MKTPLLAKLHTLRSISLRVLAGIGVLTVVTLATPWTRWVARGLADGGFAEQDSGDVMIVLAGAGVEDGILGSDSYRRAEFAASVFERGHFHTLLVTGGSDPGDPSAAGHMRELLICRGIPRAIVTTEEKSRSTRENALLSRGLLEHVGKKVLVTSDYHMFRAIRVFQKAGIDVVPKAVPDAVTRSDTWTKRAGVAANEIDELLKMIYYKLRGWM